jgi:hypothetical protein
MTEMQQTRGGFLRFLTTIPGILTAVAAIVTAAGGIYVGSHQDGSPPAPMNLYMTSVAAPDSVASVDQQSLRLSNASAGVSDLGSDDPVPVLISQCAGGDDGACASILDTLAQECTDGAGISCDVLYELSPVGSDYETYGATCGGRWASEDYADLCSEQ